MTIGVGFLCADGVALCSDRQLTAQGGFKFEERKIFSCSRADFTFVFSYAGDPDAAQVMFRKTKDGIWDGIAKAKGMFTKDKARAALEKIFQDKHTRGLQTLFGMVSKRQHFLLKTNEKKVVEAYADYIGVGDSSVLRYLRDVFKFPTNLTLSEAHILGAYLVSIANRYIDQCGGGPDYVLLRPDGTLTDGTGGPWPNERERYLSCEQQIGRGLRELLFLGGSGKLGVKPLVSQT